MNSDERQDTDWEKFHKDAFIKKKYEAYIKDNEIKYSIIRIEMGI